MNTKTLSLECLQDGLLFGIDGLKEDFPDLFPHFKEGDLILKGQKILSTKEGKSKLPKEDFAFLISYLSGAYTLISCFTERLFDFKIGASSTKNFLYKKREEQAILKAGAFLYNKFKKPVSSFDELSKKSNSTESYFLSDSLFSLKEIKQALESFPQQNFEVKAKLFPSDLEDWRHFKNIKSFYPDCLQGNFPLLKMQWI